MNSQLRASLTVMAENYIVKPMTTTTTSSSKTAGSSAVEEAMEGKPSTWKYDTETWFDSSVLVSAVSSASGASASSSLSGVSDKKAAKAGKLFKVESLSDKKVEKKKAEEI